MLTKTKEYSLPTAVLDVATEADGDTLYAACMDGVYRLKTGAAEIEKLGEHASYVSGVAVVPSRQELITAGYDGALQWYRLDTGELIRRVAAHGFWSWQMALSPDERWVASVSGQYLAGGEKYEPAEEKEPSVRVYAVDSGELVHEFSHLPPVQSVAISPDSRYLAAANLMGDIRVWDLTTGQREAAWNTPDFTSWGIIKSHCYIGGIFALQFSHDSRQLLAAGMGPMRDPMAGNGKQLWQRFAWQEDPPRKVDETHPEDSGEGLMETLALSPDHKVFVMGGRLRGGAWNVGLFDHDSGRLRHSVKTGYRVTRARYHDRLPSTEDQPAQEGLALVLAGTKSQPSAPKGDSPHFGRVEIYEVTPA
jgi:WD40 repeat protein